MGKKKPDTAEVERQIRAKARAAVQKAFEAPRGAVPGSLASCVAEGLAVVDGGACSPTRRQSALRPPLETALNKLLTPQTADTIWRELKGV